MTKDGYQSNRLTQHNSGRKSHGNRRIQRFRRKCRSKGMTKEAIEKLVEIQKTTYSIHQNNRNLERKYMNSYSTSCTDDDLNIVSSMLFENHQTYLHEYQSNKENIPTGSASGSLSILTPIISTGTWSSPPSSKTYHKAVHRYSLSTDHWKQTSMLIPNYYQLSFFEFKDLLLNIIQASNRQQIQERITNFTALQIIQHRAQLMCKVSQLRIENDYWNYISNMADIPIVIWLSEVSKDVTRQNFINWDHTKTKNNIQQRQQMIQDKLQQAEYNLNNHLHQQLDPLSFQAKTIALPDHPMTIISDALAHLVENGLHYFRMNFEQKKILLMFDTNDAQLVKSFYDLNPTSQQVSIHLLHSFYFILFLFFIIS
uniref:Uncharacterized protein n=1 Tax=Adineta vaga TaxID=104782 RepID=B3G4B5_ADIVA|nr:unknown [Adineta vaga]